MNLRAQIAGITLRAVGGRNTIGLRKGLVELTNVAVRGGLIDRVGADTLLALEGDLEDLVMEVMLLQDLTSEEEEPITEVEINLILDPWYFRFTWDLKRAFQHQISEVRYESTQPSNVVPIRAA